MLAGVVIFPEHVIETVDSLVGIKIASGGTSSGGRVVVGLPDHVIYTVDITIRIGPMSGAAPWGILLPAKSAVSPTLIPASIQGEPDWRRKSRLQRLTNWGLATLELLPRPELIPG